MRIRLGALAAVLAGASSLTVAAAATPVHNGSFSGHGNDYYNNAPHWKREATGGFSFKTSRDGKQMLQFRGTFSSYCGSGSQAVTAKYITVRPNGNFDYRFRVASKSGADYAEISGVFLHHGRRANVSYLVDFVANGKRVKHPYDTLHPRSLGCASWVRGVARAG